MTSILSETTQRNREHDDPPKTVDVSDFWIRGDEEAGAPAVGFKASGAEIKVLHDDSTHHDSTVDENIVVVTVDRHHETTCRVLMNDTTQSYWTLTQAAEAILRARDQLMALEVASDDFKEPDNGAPSTD